MPRVARITNFQAYCHRHTTWFLFTTVTPVIVTGPAPLVPTTKPQFPTIILAQQGPVKFLL